MQAQKIVALLNELFAIDPDAVHALVENRVSLNPAAYSAIEKHPSFIPYDTGAGTLSLGLIGVVNGLLGEESLKNRVAGTYDDNGKLLGFILMENHDADVQSDSESAVREVSSSTERQQPRRGCGKGCRRTSLLLPTTPEERRRLILALGGRPVGPNSYIVSVYPRPVDAGVSRCGQKPEQPGNSGRRGCLTGRCGLSRNSGTGVSSSPDAQTNSGDSAHDRPEDGARE